MAADLPSFTELCKALLTRSVVPERAETPLLSSLTDSSPFRLPSPFNAVPSSELMTQCIQLQQDKLELMGTIDKLKDELADLRKQLSSRPTGSALKPKRSKAKKPKRKRRCANEITRYYECPKCSRAYGYFPRRSESSLSQHEKLKHRDATASEGYSNM